jgi:diguanylate cyclase (GGDEF)-like protein
MLTVYNCITSEHDLRLVFLAAVICSMASFAGITLLWHACGSSGHTRNAWLSVSTVSTGFGIWATHFIGMLAFSPGIPSGYNIHLTVLSLIAAILLTGAGFFIALLPDLRFARGAGGAIVAAGIATMHYSGMAAFEVEGSILWNWPLVGMSILSGAVFGAAALQVGLYSAGPKWRVGGAALLVLAICSHHFTAMSAVSIIPNSAIEISPSAVPSTWLAAGVAVISLTIVLFASAGFALDLRDRRRSQQELDRLRSLADAAVEGLIVCDGSTIVTVNESFAVLANSTVDKLLGSLLEGCFPDRIALELLAARPNQPVESSLLRSDGTRTPVELILRHIDFAGKPNRAIAVRDLRLRKEAERRIHFLAHHDALTGLANRAQLVEVLKDLFALQSTHANGIAVHFLDLDRFKQINDTLGHDSGDFVLTVIAGRLREAAGATNFVARLGGDEFIMVQANVGSRVEAEAFAEEVSAMVSAPISFNGHVIYTTVSAGVALAPIDGDSPDRILKSADIALYKAKTARNCICFFSSEMDVALKERVELEKTIREAVCSGRFVLHYQPLFEINGRRLVGFEALIRLPSADGTLISPAVFIPVAEDIKLIDKIGAWALEEACRTAATWPGHLTVAVNLSPAQFVAGDIVEIVSDTLARVGLAANRLELEITESLLLGDSDAILAELLRLKAMGVKIAMDDFGTGYSSLSYLWRFPFDKIKLDRSFMQGFDDHDIDVGSVVKTIIALGKELKMRVTVEGVETAKQAAFLGSVGGDQVQGYFFGRPATGSGVAEIILSDFQRSKDKVLRPMRATAGREAA